MHDLARLLIARLVDFTSLKSRQRSQRMAGDLGIERKQRERSNDAVAPKQGGEPWDARHHEGAMIALRDDGGEIRGRALQQYLQTRIAGAELGPRGSGGCDLVIADGQRALKVRGTGDIHRSALGCDPAIDPHLELDALFSG